MGKRKHIVSDSESAEDEAMETPSEDEKPLKVKPKAKVRYGVALPRSCLTYCL